VAFALAATLHVGVRCVFDVAVGGCVAVGAAVGAVAVAPAVFRSQFGGAVAVAVVAVVAVVVVASSFIVLSTIGLVVIVRVVGIIDLVLELGHGRCERLHLFQHVAVLLRRICHVVDLLLHVLFGEVVGGLVVALVFR
jgi:hypothetical protein